MQRRTMLKGLAASAMLAGLKVHAAQDAGPTVIRVNIPGPHLLPFLPIELIPKLGIDQALGVQLAIRYLPSGILALDDALAGNAHFAGMAFTALPAFYAKGKPASAVAVLSSGVPPYAVLIRPDLAKSVRTLSDLKGRSIGVPMGSVTSKTYLQVMLELWLATHGVRSNEVRWVQTNQNLAGMQGSLASGTVDAVICEEPLAGTLVRKEIGTHLASLSDPNAPGRGAPSAPRPPGRCSTAEPSRGWSPEPRGPCTASSSSCATCRRRSPTSTASRASGASRPRAPSSAAR